MSNPNIRTQDADSETNIEAWSEFDIDPKTLDPNFHYRVINDRTARRARASQQRYTPVTEEDGVTSLSGRDLLSADGLIRIGDGILMKCEMDIYKERRRQSDKLTRARLRAPESQFRKRAKESSAGLEEPIRVDNSKKD